MLASSRGEGVYHRADVGHNDFFLRGQDSKNMELKVLMMDGH